MPHLDPPLLCQNPQIQRSRGLRLPEMPRFQIRHPTVQPFPDGLPPALPGLSQLGAGGCRTSKFGGFESGPRRRASETLRSSGSPDFPLGVKLIPGCKSGVKGGLGGSSWSPCLGSTKGNNGELTRTPFGEGLRCKLSLFEAQIWRSGTFTEMTLFLPEVSPKIWEALDSGTTSHELSLERRERCKKIIIIILF